MIRAIIETSLIDWDGKITTVLFFDKCNFRCPFCQNWKLILHPDRFKQIDWSDIVEMIRKKKGWIDGVVLTGGEPLVDREEIFDITNRIRDLGLLIKIDTNGAFPDVLEELVALGRADYVAMDIKAPLDKRYNIAAGVKVEINRLRQSIQNIMKETGDYEFRTTCVPGIIDEQAIRAIGAEIHGAKKWVLQAHVPANAHKKKYQTPLTTDYVSLLKYYQNLAQAYVPNTVLRGKV